MHKGREKGNVFTPSAALRLPCGLLGLSGFPLLFSSLLLNPSSQSIEACKNKTTPHRSLGRFISTSRQTDVDLRVIPGIGSSTSRSFGLVRGYILWRNVNVALLGCINPSRFSVHTDFPDRQSESVSPIDAFVHRHTEAKGSG